MRAVTLLSGGVDSTTVLAIARAECDEVLPLTFSYGQTHDVEVARAEAVARSMQLPEHLTLDIPYASIGGSSLLGDGEIPVESDNDPDAIPSTYVPARNLVFLSLAVAVAESRGCRRIYIGANAVDYSGYPDCRPAFLNSFLETANLGTKEGVEADEPWFQIRAPLVEMSKADIIRRGIELGVDYSLTLSCYEPDDQGRACGRCDSCGIRRRGFEAAGVADPTRYR